VRNV
jgi:pre-mRNA-processing factor 8